MGQKESALRETYESMLEIARMEMESGWERGQMIVLETFPGEFHWAKVEDIDASVREPIEEMLVKQLLEWNESRVLTCLCTMDGLRPEIPSWHLRSRLAEINPENLKTKTFLWGGGEDILVKPFSALLPPKKKE